MNAAAHLLIYSILLISAPVSWLETASANIRAAFEASIACTFFASIDESTSAITSAALYVCSLPKTTSTQKDASPRRPSPEAYELFTEATGIFSSLNFLSMRSLATIPVISIYFSRTAG